MNLKVDDQCKVQFENLKFRKTEARYIIYKVDKEQIVSKLIYRLSKKLVQKKKIGTAS